jgi:ABC-type sugar transport system ATPase subunit
MVLVSADLDELAGLSDRVLVMRRAELIRPFPCGPVSAPALGRVLATSRPA